ncbi:MAG TPA: CpaF family protein [Anaerolineales bacterium]|nr:CpaF family protein [Anaerolineales bacterium]
MTDPAGNAFAGAAIPDYAKLREYLIATVTQDFGGTDLAPEKRRLAVEERLKEILARTKLALSDSIRARLIRDIVDEVTGYGPIQFLLDDPNITEVMVNGPKKVYVEKKGRLERTNVVFEDDLHILKIIDRIVSPLGRHIDPDSPMVDARLPDGSRVNAIVPPCAVDGPSLTIRKFRKEKLKISQLIETNSLTQAMGEFLRACVLGRLNIIISGGTGSGKTTFLNVLSGFIPEEERIVTIEDAAELQLQQDHVVRLETKLASVEGQGAVSIRELVRNSLRMRPDRIVVGECRGGEALDMLQAMNTGHDGSLTTIHANSPRDALSRLETLVLMAGMDLPLKIVRQQISSAVDVIVQMSRLRDGARKITAISEVAGMEGDVVVLSDIFKFNQTGVDAEGKILGQHKATGIRPLFGPRLEAAGFKLGADIFGATAADMAMSHQRR